MWLFFLHLLDKQCGPQDLPFRSGWKRLGGSPEATREAVIPVSPFFDSSWRTWLTVVELSLEETVFWQALENGEGRYPAEFQAGDQEGVGRVLHSLSPY